MHKLLISASYCRLFLCPDRETTCVWEREKGEVKRRENDTKIERENRKKGIVCDCVKEKKREGETETHFNILNKENKGKKDT